MKTYFIILIFALYINTLSRKIIDVVYIDQTKDYPTGCESVSTVMCLKYFGFNITVNEFIDDYLDKGEIYYENNQMFAPDPNDKFVGSPYDGNSYGCYEPVITKALNRILIDKEKDSEFEIKNLTNVPMKTIIKEYIDKDIPVIFWSTINLLPMRLTSIWTIPETGKQFQWRANEHCLLLVGYDNEESKYYFNDPWDNHGVIGYDMYTVEQRHKEQYSMAVALVKSKK